jgi:hypothetical protein
MVCIPEDLEPAVLPSPLLLASGVGHGGERDDHEPASHARAGGKVSEEPCGDYTCSVRGGEMVEVEKVWRTGRKRIKRGRG